jgi:hypothetical protein
MSLDILSIEMINIIADRIPHPVKVSHLEMAYGRRTPSGWNPAILNELGRDV